MFPYDRWTFVYYHSSAEHSKNVSTPTYGIADLLRPFCNDIEYSGSVKAKKVAEL